MGCNLQGQVEFWQALFVLLSIATLAVLAVPAFADRVARWLHAHSIALTALYKVMRAAIRAYRRIHQTVMEETAQ
jgi:hypothetical protein